MPRGITKRGGRYYGRWVDSYGVRRNRPLADRLDDAERILNKLRADADLERAGLGAMVRQAVPLEDLVAPYLDELANRATAWHCRNVRDWLEDVVHAIGARRPVSDLRVDHVLAVRSSYLKAGKSNRTANAKIGALRAMLRWAEASGLIFINPVPNLPQLPETGRSATRRRHRLVSAEVDCLLRAADAIDKVTGGVPQAPTLRVLLDSGLRTGEASSLLWGDLVAHGGESALRVSDVVSKSGHGRTVPIPGRLSRELRRLRSMQGKSTGRLPSDGDPMLTTRDGKPMNQRWAKRRLLRFLDACIEWRPDSSEGDWPLQKTYPDGTTIDLHALRHTYATLLGESGADLGTISYLLGHSTIQMSARYADLGRRDARTAVDRMSAMTGQENSKDDDKWPESPHASS